MDASGLVFCRLATIDEANGHSCIIETTIQPTFYGTNIHFHKTLRPSTRDLKHVFVKSTQQLLVRQQPSKLTEFNCERTLEFCLAKPCAQLAREQAIMPKAYPGFLRLAIVTRLEVYQTKEAGSVTEPSLFLFLMIAHRLRAPNLTRPSVRYTDDIAIRWNSHPKCRRRPWYPWLPMLRKDLASSIEHRRSLQELRGMHHLHRPSWGCSEHCCPQRRRGHQIRGSSKRRIRPKTKGTHYTTVSSVAESFG